MYYTDTRKKHTRNITHAIQVMLKDIADSKRMAAYRKAELEKTEHATPVREIAINERVGSI